jgi:ABC-type Na+ efflux pump permease subunit
MKILDIALKDLTRSFRSAMAMVFMFVIPLGITTLFYFMFGSQSEQGGFDLQEVKVVVANLDQDAPRLEVGKGSIPGGIHAHSLSELVIAVLNSDDMADLLEVSEAPDAASAQTAVDSRQQQVAVIIPDGFSRQFGDLYGKSEITFYKDPTLTIAPAIVQTILNQFMDGLSGVKIAADVAVEMLGDEDISKMGLFIQRYLDSSLSQSQDLSATFLDVQVPQESTTQDSIVVRILGPIMGGMMIFYAFYTGASTGESILREEEERTLPRLFTTPTSQATILIGKFLSIFITVIVQIVVLLITARFVFEIHWGAFSSVFLVAVGTVLSASAFGIFINSLLRDTKQGGLVFGGVLAFSGMLGMMSIFTMASGGNSDAVNIISLLVPQGWAIRGLLQSINGQPVQEVLLTSLGLLAWSILFFFVGVWRFQHRYA